MANIYFSFLTSRLSHKKTIFFVLLTFIALGIALPSMHAAQASWNPFAGIGDAAAAAFKVLGNMVLTIPFILPLLLTALYSFLSTNLLKLAIFISTNGVSFTSLDATRNAAVALGWPIVRNLANIFIVLGLIGTALATILRWPDGWQAKQILPKLIIAALLINFSLVICGVFIDASNAGMQLFLNAAGNQLESTVNTRAWEQVGTLFTIAANPDTNPLLLAIKLLANVAFNLVSGSVLLLYALLYLFRIIALWILVILSPLAFIFAVFPNTQKFWSMWKENFIQWCIIGIPGALFMYLGEQLMVRINESPNMFGGPLAAGALPASSGVTGVAEITQQFTNLFTFFIPAAFLVVGFLVTLQTSAIGSSLAKQWGEKAAWATGKWMGKATAASGLISAKYTAGGIAGATGGLGGGVRGAWQGWRNGTGVWAGARTGAVGGAQAGVAAAVTAKNAAKTVGSAGISAGRWIGTAGDRALEQAGYNEEGEQDMIERDRRKKASKDAEALSSNRTRAQIMASIDSTPTTDSARAQVAADIKTALAKNWLGDRSVEQRMALASRANLDSGSWDGIVSNMDAQDAAHIVRNDLFSNSGKAKEEALKRLKAKNQLDLLTQDETIAAITEQNGRGADMSDTINGLSSSVLAGIINRHQGSMTTPAIVTFDPSTRAKVLKALADKRQLDQIGSIGETITVRRQRKIEAILEAAANGGVPQDIIEKMNSDDKAEILNEPTLLLNDRRLTDQQRLDIIGKTTGSLMKTNELHLIQPGERKAEIFNQAVQGGFIEAEDLEQKSYTGAGLNTRRLMSLGASEAQINSRNEALRTPSASRTLAQHGSIANMQQFVDQAEDQVLNEKIEGMRGDELRDVSPLRLQRDPLSDKNRDPAYAKICRLTVKQINAFATMHAGPAKRDMINALWSHRPDLVADSTDLTIPINKRRRLVEILRAIDNLR